MAPEFWDYRDSGTNQWALRESSTQTRFYLFAVRHLHKQVFPVNSVFNVFTGHKVLGTVVLKIAHPVNSHVLIRHVLDLTIVAAFLIVFLDYFFTVVVYVYH